MTVSHEGSVGRQVLRRKINERLHDAADGTDSNTIDVFCECGGRTCAAQIRVAVHLYESVVTSARLFLVAEGHEEPATEGSRLAVRRAGRCVLLCWSWTIASAVWRRTRRFFGK